MAEHIDSELAERYERRAAFFWRKARNAKFKKLQSAARSASWQGVIWDWSSLGITETACKIANDLGFVPTEVFAHPEITAKNPSLLNYYRMLACLSQKGLAQIRNKGPSDKAARLLDTCQLLNRFISALLAAIGKTDRDILLGTIYAEAGSEWQGEWVNIIGRAAALELESIIVEFATENGLLEKADIEKHRLKLKSGATLIFGSEPDVECRDVNGDLLCVMEIKGSADKAGAQTRLGETKKSFTKAKLENPRCHTIFLPSVLTQAVEQQLKTERDIDQVFNLLAIFRDPDIRKHFLIEVFRFRLREKL